MAAASRQQHLDPLSALDAAFLLQERPNAHMHIGGVAIFQRPAAGLRRVPRPTCAAGWTACRATARSSRSRRSASGARAGSTIRRFNLEYHVRTHGAARPRDDEQLRRLVARMYSQRLDRAKPLWELLLIEGLDGRPLRILIAKTHHAVVDGISGIDITAALFDVSRSAPAVRDATAAQRRAARRGSRGPSPRRPSWRRPRSAAARATSRASRCARSGPSPTAPRLRSAVRGFADDRAHGAAPRPGLAAQRRDRPAPARRLRRRRSTTSSASRTRSAGRVNDVVLAVVAGALRAWMHARGLRPRAWSSAPRSPSRPARAGEHGALGNQHHAAHRAAARRRRRPGRAAAPDPGRDDRPEGDPPGARRRGHRAARRSSRRRRSSPSPRG